MDPYCHLKWDFFLSFLHNYNYVAKNIGILYSKYTQNDSTCVCACNMVWTGESRVKEEKIGGYAYLLRNLDGS